MDFLYSTN